MVRRAAAPCRNKKIEEVRSSVLADAGAERLPGIVTPARKPPGAAPGDRSLLESFSEWLMSNRGQETCSVQMGLFDTHEDPAGMLESLADGMRRLKPTPGEIQRFIAEYCYESPALTDYSMLCAVRWFLEYDAIEHMLGASAAGPFRCAAVEAYDVIDHHRIAAMADLSALLSCTPGSRQCAAAAMRFSRLFEASSRVRDLQERDAKRAQHAMSMLASSVVESADDSPSPYLLTSPADLTQGQLLRIAQSEGLPVSPNQLQRREMLKAS